MKRRWTAGSTFKSATPYLFLAPAVAFMLVLMFYPIARGIITSFFYNVLSQPEKTRFIGLGNYLRLYEDPLFWLSLKNSIIWTGGSLLFQFLGGLCLALLLNAKFRGQGLLQGILFSPWATAGFVVAIMWQFLLHAHWGTVNDVLVRMGLIQDPILFLSKPQLALPSVIVANVWYGIPFFGIMLLAGLQSIPTELYEAAIVDGAGRWAQFWNITLPLLKPVIVSTIVLRAMWIMNWADIVYIMTRGGPANSSHILVTYMFQKAYTSLDFGYAAALSVMLMAILLIFTILFFKITGFEEEEGGFL